VQRLIKYSNNFTFYLYSTIPSEMMMAVRGNHSLMHFLILVGGLEFLTQSFKKEWGEEKEEIADCRME
jgi:hypothetical protein